MQLDSHTSILALQHIPGVGPVRLGQLLAHFKTPQAVLKATRDELAELGQTKLLSALADQLANIQAAQNSHPLIQAAEREVDYCHRHGMHLLSIDSSDYPAYLKQIAAPPPLLYVKGDLHSLNKPQLAMVGARNASIEGLRNATTWANALALAGLVITSGLAEGIDGAAHRGALQAGQPTIAVLAHGLDKLYPRVHKRLSEDIITAGGALVSEFAIGTAAKREYFPRRNRIISGLSLGVCVIEAAIKSGSLITARYAVEQNREVFALPSHIQNSMAEGCHYLIQQGAELVTQPQDIVHNLQQNSQLQISSIDDASPAKTNYNTASSKTSTEQTKPKDTDPLLDLLPFSPMHFDELASHCNLSPQALSAQLVLLEMQGKIVAESGFYRRII